MIASPSLLVAQVIIIHISTPEVALELPSGRYSTCSSSETSYMHSELSEVSNFLRAALANPVQQAVETSTSRGAFVGETMPMASSTTP